jgi:hypothetical protein
MTTASTTAAAQPPRGVGFWVTLTMLCMLTAALTWKGFDFYRQDLASRPLHPQYRALNPAGFVGHGYGMLGTAMIATNLLYLVRRRFAKHLPAWIGSMKAWLNAHAFTGLVGSVLILFHSAFQLRTPIATVTSVSLAIVVVTGLIGLYLHRLTPRNALHPLNERLGELEPLLPGVGAHVHDLMKDVPVTKLPYDASFTRTLFTIPRWVLQARKRRNGMKQALRRDKLFRVLEGTDPKLAHRLAVEIGVLAAVEVDAQVGGSMMRSWRSLHRFLALLMLVSVSVHIGVAWYYGFRWIFE